MKHIILIVAALVLIAFAFFGVWLAKATTASLITAAVFILLAFALALPAQLGKAATTLAENAGKFKDYIPWGKKDASC